MFGAFTLGSFVYGVDIWGNIAPIRLNPDIDGVFIQTQDNIGTFAQATIATDDKYIVDPFVVSDYTRIK